MTEREWLNRLLAKSLQKHGENGFMVRQLRAQLHSLDRFEPLEKQYHQFHIGAREGPEERAEAEAEKRQQEEEES